MSATSIRQRAGPGKTAKAVILYDRIETMLVANELLGQLSPRTEGCVDWTVNSWRFDMLGRWNESQRALEETFDVELMIVAIGDAQALESWPSNWLVLWAARRQNTGVLSVLLVDSGAVTRESPWVIGPLLELAESHQLEFFVVDAVMRNRVGNGSRGFAYRTIPHLPWQPLSRDGGTPTDPQRLGKHTSALSESLSWVQPRAD